MSILYRRTRKKTILEKAKITFIIVVIYYIIYLLSGLIVGYKNSPYSLKFFEVIKNFITIFGITVLLEYVRCKIVKRYHNIPVLIIVTILFVFLKVDDNVIKGLVSVEEVLEFILGNLLPNIIESILLTYLSLTGGYLLNFAYTVPISLATILLPIFPDLSWFIYAAFQYATFLFIFIFANYENLNKYAKRQVKKQNPIWSIPIIVFIILIALFVAGFFPYSPVAIISNSMIPAFSRGDICIMKKIEDYKEIRNINIGDIIEYNLNSISIVHRVEKIEKIENGYQFITKGDNNQNIDLLPVKEEQVMGIVCYTLPYIGYPSVWFSEFLLGLK